MDEISKWKKSIIKLKRKCKKKKENHQDRNRLLLLHFGNKSHTLNPPFDSIDPRIVALTKVMGKLTGMIRTSNGIGTCFLQKICRKTNEAGENYALLTFTTVYHVFSVKEDNLYKLALTWNELNLKVYMFYDKTVLDLYNERKTPVLTHFRLLDTDKEEGVENDWCAIECEVPCNFLYYKDDKDDEGRNLVHDLESFLDEYKTKQKEIFQLIKDKKIINNNLVIILGHPHGLPKQVSVGRHFEDLKDEPKVVRSSQLWCRYYYDAPTCGGNSGAPVFILGQPIAGYGFWFGHPHNHKMYVSEKKNIVLYNTARSTYPLLKSLGMSSVGVEQCDH